MRCDAIRFDAMRFDSTLFDSETELTLFFFSQDKIKQAEENLKLRKSEHNKCLRDESQKKARIIQKFGDPNGKVPESVSQEAWTRRYEASVLIEKRGEWEHRRIESEVDDDKENDANQDRGTVTDDVEQQGNKKNIFTPIGTDFYFRGVPGGELECR